MGTGSTTGSSEIAASLDHLVGACEQRRRDGEAGGFCGGEINSKLEARRLFNRNIGAPLALQYSVHIIGHTASNGTLTRPVGHEGAGFENLLYPDTGR